MGFIRFFGTTYLKKVHTRNIDSLVRYGFLKLKLLVPEVRNRP